MEWNTDLIEAMELEHVMCQDAQDLDDGETRLESRETREHQFHEERLVSSTTRPSRAEEVCLNNACTLRIGKLSLNCLFPGRNNNNFDLCRPLGN